MALPTVDIDSGVYTTYASIDTADTYLGAAYHATGWSDLTENQKGQLLVTSTRTLDRQKWKGSKEEPDQPLAFPRDGMGISPEPLEDENGLPLDIIDASIELALAISQGSDVQTASSQATRIQSMSAGSVSITYFRNPDGTPTRFPTIVQELIQKFLGGDLTAYYNKATGVDAESVTANLDLGFSSGVQ